MQRAASGRIQAGWLAGGPLLHVTTTRRTTDTFLFISHTTNDRQDTGWLAGGPLLHVTTTRRTTDTFLFISHTTNVLLFKSRCNIFIGFGIIKELPGLVGGGTSCIF